MCDNNSSDLEAIYWAEPVKQSIKLRTNLTGQPVCPVCGTAWDVGAEHAWCVTGQVTRDGSAVVVASYSICPVCNTEFGNDDIPSEGETLEQSWAWLRGQWLERVGRTPDILDQLRTNLGLDV